MSYLIDTNILARLANSSDLLNPSASRAVLELHRRSEVMQIAPQNLVEFRSMATRPASLNGLGLSLTDTEVKAEGFEQSFTLLSETPDIFPAWKLIVEKLGISGKQVHDARLLAICHVHGVTHILTFNTSHFTRFTGFGPGVIVVDPASV